MNSNINKENQNITIIDRKELKITGVNKIESLNDKEFLVKTINGNITICGENLEMKHLDLERQIYRFLFVDMQTLLNYNIHLIKVWNIKFDFQN